MSQDSGSVGRTGESTEDPWAVGMQALEDDERLNDAQWPYISVVVPAYNEREAIGPCIEALLAQDYPAERREILIVDNNSTDGTAEIVHQKPVTLLYERHVQTSYAARNTGIRHAQGEIIAFTDADCIPKPDWLSHLALGFRDPHVLGLAGVVEPVKAAGLVSRFLAQVNPVRSQQIDGLWYVITANAAYRRQALLEAGCFCSDLFTAGDIDLSLRLQLNGKGRIESAPLAVIYHEYGNSWRELWARFRRYGYSEILMKRLHNRRESHARHTSSQLRALATYMLSFLWRLRKIPRAGWQPYYNLSPVLWGVAEIANLWGKLQALWATRGLKRGSDRMAPCYSQPAKRERA